MTRSSDADPSSPRLPLARRAQLARGQAEALTALAGSGEGQRSAAAALAHVARALGADRASIFEFCADPFSAVPIACRRVAWSRTGQAAADSMMHVSAHGQWHAALDGGDWICDPVDARPAPEREGLAADGTTFLLVMPLRDGEDLWGGLRFDACDGATRWTDAEAAALQPVADALMEVLSNGFVPPPRVSNGRPAPPDQASGADPASGDVSTGSAEGAETEPQSVEREPAAGPSVEPGSSGDGTYDAVHDGGRPSRGGFAVIAPDGAVVYRSPAFDEVVGSSRRETPLTDWIAAGEERHAVDVALQGGTAYEGDIPLRADSDQDPSDAAPTRVLLYLTPLRDVEGQHRGHLGWLYDEASAHIDEVLQDLRLHHRVRSERALVEASRLLVSADTFDMEALLSIIGEATGADHAYLVTITPEGEDRPAPGAGLDRAEGQPPPIELDAYEEYTWTAPGRDIHLDQEEHGGAEAQTFAVPILSADGQLFGYLGIEYEGDSTPLQDADARVLNVLGDMLCTYLQRQLSERALRRSEQRYRHFVDTISEAIWRVEIDPPVRVDQDPEAQVEHVLDRGVIAECNSEMAKLFGLERPEQVVGWDLAQAVRYTGRGIVESLVETNYRLRSKEVVVRGDAGARHFIVNTIGVVEAGQLHGLWGSATEVTDRVELERRMVSALEQQQQRIGRDLHDNVGQLLTGVRMLAQNLADRHFEEGSSGHQRIERIVSYANEATEHVSNLQRGLMPVQTERGGLAQALSELASNTNAFPNIECIYVHDETTDVTDKETKLQLYRIAQEATNNAVKHADASYIKIMLKTEGDRLVLQVEDDGQGFDVDACQGKSLGLHSMVYRARSVDAEMEIDSEPGLGTTVQCELPLEALPQPEGESSASAG